MPVTMIEQELKILIEENEKLHKEIQRLRDKIRSLENQNEKLSQLLSNDTGG